MNEQPLPASVAAPAGQRVVSSALNFWFRRPPRLHGENNPDRTVSFLELLYDLVFVVLIGQAAYPLAHEPSWRHLADFAVVFSLIWLAWLNGSLFHEGHGREDGRGRNNIFGQMTILVVLAVFVARATGEDARPFAATYAVLLCWIAWQWNQVRCHDTVPIYRKIAAGYIAMLVVGIGLMAASTLVTDTARLILWVLTLFINLAVPIFNAIREPERPLGLPPTESMAERFSLLAIIVMGEVVVGVVNGINSAQRDVLVIVTAVLALGTGFGFWWNYFDLLGRRPSRPTQRAFTVWVLAQLPLTGSIAALGAGMVGVIHHAHSPQMSRGSGWLMAGSSATVLVMVAVLTTTLDYRPLFKRILSRIQLLLLAGAVASLAVGVLLPPAWLLTLLLALVHQAVWWSAFVQLAKHTQIFTSGRSHSEA